MPAHELHQSSARREKHNALFPEEVKLFFLFLKKLGKNNVPLPQDSNKTALLPAPMTSMRERRFNRPHNRIRPLLRFPPHYRRNSVRSDCRMVSSSSVRSASLSVKANPKTGSSGTSTLRSSSTFAKCAASRRRRQGFRLVQNDHAVDFPLPAPQDGVEIRLPVIQVAVHRIDPKGEVGHIGRTQARETHCIELDGQNPIALDPQFGCPSAR